MRPAFLSLSLAALLALPAHARLGETADELVMRYGQPLKEADQKAEGDKIPLANVAFQRGGFQIEVTITNGVSVQEHFHKLNGQPIDTDEVRTLLAANAQGRTWLAPQTMNGERTWMRDDATMAKLSADGTLTIALPALNAQEAVAKKLTEKPSLQGF